MVTYFGLFDHHQASLQKLKVHALHVSCKFRNYNSSVSQFFPYPGIYRSSFCEKWL